MRATLSSIRKVCDPRKNKRPAIPDSCPPRVVDLMKKCWSPDPYHRPEAKDLDVVFLDMNTQDVDPVIEDLMGKTTERTTGGKPAYSTLRF